jgi:hypothetical protein
MPSQVQGVTDEDTKSAFLQTQNGSSKAKAKPTPTPDQEEKAPQKAKPKKPKPKPAQRKKHPSDEGTSVPAKAHPTPEHPKKQEETSPAPRETPSPKPSPERSPAAPQPPASMPASVIIQKSTAAGEDEPAPTPEPDHHWSWWPFGHATHYKYLTPAIRDAIDHAPVSTHPARWRYIVVHNSGTRQGNAKAFDYYHRFVRKMPNGLAYHFVIGNGTSSGNGAIEIGSRWTRQINGGHVHSDYLNNIALGICLVGDFNHDQPTPQQLEALEELIKYLRNRVGKTDHKPAVVKAHKDINPAQWPTDCPGDKFPYAWLARFY